MACSSLEPGLETDTVSGSGPRVGKEKLVGRFRHLLLLVKDGQHLVLELGVLASLQLVLHPYDLIPVMKPDSRF